MKRLVAALTVTERRTAHMLADGSTAIAATPPSASVRVNLPVPAAKSATSPSWTRIAVLSSHATACAE